MSSDLKDLLIKLLSRNPHERLGVKGADEIKSHAFFKDIDWSSFDTMNADGAFEGVLLPERKQRKFGEKKI